MDGSSHFLSRIQSFSSTSIGLSGISLFNILQKCCFHLSCCSVLLVISRLFSLKMPAVWFGFHCSAVWWCYIVVSYFVRLQHFQSHLRCYLLSFVLPASLPLYHLLFSVLFNELPFSLLLFLSLFCVYKLSYL